MKPLVWMKRSLLLTDEQRARAADAFVAALSAEITRLRQAAEQAQAADHHAARAALRATNPKPDAVGVRMALDDVHQAAVSYVMAGAAGYHVHDFLRGAQGDTGSGPTCNRLLAEVGTRLAAHLSDRERARAVSLGAKLPAAPAVPVAPSPLRGRGRAKPFPSGSPFQAGDMVIRVVEPQDARERRIWAKPVPVVACRRSDVTGGWLVRVKNPHHKNAHEYHPSHFRRLKKAQPVAASAVGAHG